MSEFNPETFMVEPNQSTFNQLRKDDLMSLGKHLKLEMRSSLGKRETQKLRMEHLVHETQSFEQSVLSAYNITQEESNTAVVDLSDSPSIDTENQRDRERQWQKELEEIAWRRERENCEWEAQRAREEREFRLREQEIELQKFQLQNQSTVCRGVYPIF